MRNSLIKESTFGMLNFIFEGKGVEDEELTVINAFANIQKKFEESAKIVANQVDDS
jgi:hypothetical protein